MPLAPSPNPAPELLAVQPPVAAAPPAEASPAASAAPPTSIDVAAAQPTAPITGIDQAVVGLPADSAAAPAAAPTQVVEASAPVTAPITAPTLSEPAAAPPAAPASNPSASALDAGTQAGAPQTPDQLAQLDAGVNAGAVSVENGTVRIDQRGGTTQVVLAQPELEVRHLVGQITGSVISNTSNNVTIDTTTVVSISLSDATAFNLGSLVARIDGLALDAAARLVR